MDEEQRRLAAERWRARVMDPAFQERRAAAFRQYVATGDKSARLDGLRAYHQTPEFTENQRANGEVFAARMVDDPEFRAMWVRKMKDGWERRYPRVPAKVCEEIRALYATASPSARKRRMWSAPRIAAVYRLSISVVRAIVRRRGRYSEDT